jgi:hypothetical protein
VEDLHREWGRIGKLLSFEAVKRYSAENEIKTQDLPAVGYADYLRAAYSELSAELELSMERTVSQEAETGPLAFPIGLSGSVSGERLISEPYTRLLDLGSSVVVTAELGGGKTHLTKMLARGLIRATEEDPEAPVPVVLRARMWKRDFSSFAEGIKKEIDGFVPGPAESAIWEDLEAGRFVVLVDGLDEAPRDQVDLLYAEMLRVARRTPTRIVATCRKQDYGQELRERFDECSIDLLTREQVIEYASRELDFEVPGAPTGVRFFYGIGEDLAQLVLNPLFLVMTVAVMKTKTGGKIPRHRAELYSDYARALLEGWERLRGPGGAFAVDAGTKATVLAEYARATWGRPPDDARFNRAVTDKKGFWDGAKVREELFGSGLLRAEGGGPEFFHPSFKEYFLALDLSKKPDDELARLVEENHSDDAYAEVFAFVVGLLEDQDRQAMVLDRLEIRNLYLFRRCLGTRSGFDTQSAHAWPEGLTVRYLSQLRGTYARLADAHFGRLRHLLKPWSQCRVSEEEAERFEVGIKGYLNPDRMSLVYQINLAEEPASELVVLGYPSRDSPFGYRRLNLSYKNRGLDSAREIALEDVRASLRDVLKERKLPLGDNHALGVEYVEEELRKLRNAARWGHGVPAQFKGLSLRRSVEEVISVLEGDPQAVTFAKARQSPATGHMATHADFPRMRAYLEQLVRAGLDPQQFLPPDPDVPADQVKPMRSGGVLAGKLYSDEAAVVAVGRYYDLYQLAYRWIAENLFSTLKDQLYFYRVGPVKYRVLIFRNPDEDVDPEFRGKPSVVLPKWEPVASSADSATVCEVTYEWPYDQGYDVFADAPRVKHKLGELGRMNGLVRRQMRFGSRPRLGEFFGRMAVHNAVYKQLKQDIVRDLLGDILGRLP